MLDEIVEPSGYSKNDSGMLGAIWIGSAILGGLAGGPIIDRTRQYKKFMVSVFGFFFFLFFKAGKQHQNVFKVYFLGFFLVEIYVENALTRLAAAGSLRFH